MNVVAPGKLLLSGAYAVLEGAPAIAVAIDRYARAFERRDDAESPSIEVRAAFGDARAPACDARDLHDGDAKLGLGSSAAVLVASLGFRAAGRGEDLADPITRRAIFDDARRAHAVAQGGGSGVDIAASTYGGAIRYAIDADSKIAKIEPISLPKSMHIAVFWSGTSARTSDLLALVASLRSRDASTHRAHFTRLAAAARDASRAVDHADADAFVAATRAHVAALAALGRDAGAPILTPLFAALAEAASIEGAAFSPSGAGGGDVAVYLGPTAPTSAFLAHAHKLGARALAIAIDPAGVRVVASQDDAAPRVSPN